MHLRSKTTAAAPFFYGPDNASPLSAASNSDAEKAVPLPRWTDKGVRWLTDGGMHAAYGNPASGGASEFPGVCSLHGHSRKNTRWKYTTHR